MELYKTVATADPERIARTLTAIQEGMLSVRLTSQDPHCITAVVSSSAIKRNRKKEERMETNVYTVTITPRTCTCSCPDATYRDIVACKHAVAVAISACEQKAA